MQKSPQSPFGRHFAERGGPIKNIYQTGGEPVKPIRRNFQGSSQYNRALQQYYKDLDAYNDTIPAVTDTTNVPIVEKVEETGKRPIDKIFKPSSKTQLQRFTKADYEKAKKILEDNPEAKTREEKIRVLKANGLTDDKVRNLYEYAISQGDDIFESSIIQEDVEIAEPSVAREKAAEMYTVGPWDLDKQEDGSFLPKEGAISTSPDRAIWKGDQWTDNPEYMDTATFEEQPAPMAPPYERAEGPRAEQIPVDEEAPLPDPRYNIPNPPPRDPDITPVPSIQPQQIPQTISNPPSGPNLPYMPGPAPSGPTGSDKMLEAAVELGLLDADPNTWTPKNVQEAEDAMQYNDPSGFGKFFGKEEGWSLKDQPQQAQQMDPDAYGGMGTNIKGWGPLGVTLAQGIDTDEKNYFKDIEEEGIADMTKGIDVYDKGKIEARRMIDRTRRQGIMSLDNYVQSAQQRRSGQRAYDVMAMEQTPLSDLRFDTAKASLWKDIGGARFKGDIYDATGATARDERLDKNRDAYHTALAENLTNLGTSMENRAAVLNQNKRNTLLDEWYRQNLDPERGPVITGGSCSVAGHADQVSCETAGGVWTPTPANNEDAEG